MSQSLKVLQPEPPTLEAQQYADTYSLGAPLNEYKVGYSKLVVTGMISGFGIVVLFGIIVALMFANNQAGDSSDLILLIGIFMALGLLAGIYYLLYPVIYKSWHIYICTNGFVSTRGKKILAYRWDQVLSVTQAIKITYTYGIKTSTIHLYTVQGKDGSKLKIKDDYLDVENLGNTLLEQTKNVLLPQAIADYNAGHTVTFGPLSVNQQGISNGRSLLLWNQVSNIELVRGTLVVSKEGKFLDWAAPMVATIPNIYVLMGLINHIATGSQA